MAGLPWYAHNIEKYERKTAHLSLLQHGVYRILMDHYYKTAAPLPAKLEQVHRVCRALADEEKAAVSAILAEFFTFTDDGWRLQPADEELSRMADISGKRQKAAQNRHSSDKTAAANGGAKAHAIAPASADQLHTHLHTQDISSLHSDISATPKPRRKSQPRNNTPLPADCPSPADLKWSDDYWRGEGRDDLRDGYCGQVQKFRDHHTAKGTRFRDWSAAWRTWAQNAIQFNQGRQNGRTKQRSAHDKFLAAAASIIDDLRDGAPEPIDGGDALEPIGYPLLPP